MYKTIKQLFIAIEKQNETTKLFRLSNDIYYLTITIDKWDTSKKLHTYNDYKNYLEDFTQEYKDILSNSKYAQDPFNINEFNHDNKEIEIEVFYHE